MDMEQRSELLDQVVNLARDLGRSHRLRGRGCMQRVCNIISSSYNCFSGEMAAAAGDLVAAAGDIVDEILDSTDAMETGGADTDALSFVSGDHAPSHEEASEEEDDEVMDSEDEESEDLLSEDRYNSAGEEVSFLYKVTTENARMVNLSDGLIICILLG